MLYLEKLKFSQIGNNRYHDLGMKYITVFRSEPGPLQGCQMMDEQVIY